jgi:hypothetical protein
MLECLEVPSAGEAPKWQLGVVVPGETKKISKEVEAVFSSTDDDDDWGDEDNDNDDDDRNGYDDEDDEEEWRNGDRG